LEGLNETDINSAAEPDPVGNRADVVEQKSESLGWFKLNCQNASS
jgi:hypothetical protein